VLATPHRGALGDHTGFLTGERDEVFPVPHDRRFDLARAGGEWIDAVAREARAVLRRWEGPEVVGHADWRVEHLRYTGGRLCAVHDWDSLVVRPEAALAGALSGAFSVDWTQIERCSLPTPDDAAGFVADYEAARGRPFEAAERDLARAALVFQLAYNARCEWSDWGTIRPGSQAARLAAVMGS
jgi:hypothetical protein